MTLLPASKTYAMMGVRAQWLQQVTCMWTYVLRCVLECAGLGRARSIALLAGGGGRGMRVHHLRQQGLPEALTPCQRGAHRVPHCFTHLALQPGSPPSCYVSRLCTSHKQSQPHAMF